MKKELRIVSLIILVALMLGACAPAAVQPTQPAAVKAAPTSLKIAMLNPTAKEQPWNSSLIMAMDRVVAAKPHGLTITYTFQEQIATTDGVRVMGEMAQGGQYGIIWAHDSYPDALAALGPKYPDIAWVGAGSGYKPMGKNLYWVDMDTHEAAYLNGVTAGKMTKTNMIGAVGAYPYQNVNQPINAFFEGAKSVNSNIKAKMNYISSWYDPAKGKEAALSEIAAGADMVYAERFGPFEAATEKGVYAFGYFTDQNTLAPNTVISSSVAMWDPLVNAIIDAWWNHMVNGTPYNGPTDKALVFSMKDGGCDVAPFHSLDAKVPQDVKDLIAKIRADILAGKLVIPANPNEVKGD